jgi:hypothetical protein
MTADSWDVADAFFAEFEADADERGEMSNLNLRLLREARTRWSKSLECHRVMGFGMVFNPRGAPYTDWVRVEPQFRKAGLVVAVSLLTSRPLEPHRNSGGTTVGGDICRPETAPAVLESFLLQLGEPGT